MQPKRKSLGKVLLISLPILMLIFLGGRYFIFTQIRKAIRERLTNLRTEGIDIRFDDVQFNIWNGRIAVRELHAGLGEDSVQQGLTLATPLFVIDGIQLLPFITSRTLSISTIKIFDPRIAYNDRAKFPDKKIRKSVLDNIQIEDIRISNASVLLKDSTGTDTTARINLQLDVKHLGLRTNRDSVIWDDADISVRDLKVDLPTMFYSCSLRSLHLSLADKIFQMDSLRIIPAYGKRAFMKKVNKQTDRISGLISHLTLEGMEATRDSVLHISVKKMSTNFYLDIFRDKRYPFIKNFHTILPAHFVQRLPFQFMVDSFRVNKSYISYEEFPEKGDSSGRVFFEKLSVNIVGLHNQPHLKNSVEMDAYAKFMGAGDLTAHFTFPTDTLKPYRARGSLKNFRMDRLNDMLGAAAQVKISSGVMQELKFNFQYNPLRSVGEVELNYKDLKIVSLRENKNQKQAISFIKTLILNTFIIKKNMDEDLADDKKTGTILFYRDTKRSIFNYWWKSILSGIKSAYNLDRRESALKKKAEKRAGKVKK